MGREIRITIDDDEIFERMKARKRELDLSWEEVLHRGLRRTDEAAEYEQHRGGERGHGHGHSHGPGYATPPPPDPISSPSGFAEDLKRQITGQVRQSLHASLDPEFESERAVRDPFDRDDLEDAVDSLAAAEDAVLVFDFLGEDAREPANRVPLRVALEASAGGLDVEVVAVRRGKTVTEMNAFDRRVRGRIVEGLATGESATLALEPGVEEYRVSPTLSWSREDGHPVVADVVVDEVRFDDD